MLEKTIFFQNVFYADMEQMKERFVRLLLGEDMTGRGNGVSAALALSNAITNLAGNVFFYDSSLFEQPGGFWFIYLQNFGQFAASVFGKQNKLVPVPEDRKRKWRKEIDWLLAVTDYIVEFVPSQQIGKDGSNMEVIYVLFWCFSVCFIWSWEGENGRVGLLKVNLNSFCTKKIYTKISEHNPYIYLR